MPYIDRHWLNNHDLIRTPVSLMWYLAHSFIKKKTLVPVPQIMIKIHSHNLKTQLFQESARENKR